MGVVEYINSIYIEVFLHNLHVAERKLCDDISNKNERLMVKYSNDVNKRLRRIREAKEHYNNLFIG